MNFVSIGFAIILIVFDALFIQTPCNCYLATLCDSNFADVYNCTNAIGKLRIVKSQLACTVTMLALNIGYIIIFLIIVALTHVSYKPLTPSFQHMPSSPEKLQNSPIQTSAYQPPRQPVSYPSPYNSRYEPAVYPEQTGYWRPSTPYFNRIEKF